MPHSNFKRKATEFEAGVGGVPVVKPLSVHPSKN